MNIRNCIRTIESCFFFFFFKKTLDADSREERPEVQNLSLRDYASLLVFCLRQRMHQGPAYASMHMIYLPGDLQNQCKGADSLQEKLGLIPLEYPRSTPNTPRISNQRPEGPFLH